MGRDEFFNLSGELLAVSDRTGVFVRVNLAWNSVLGWAPARLKGKTLDDFVHPTEIGEGGELVRDPEAGGVVRLLGTDGAYRWIDWTVTPRGESLYWVGKDVTEQRLGNRHRRLLEKAVDTAAESFAFIREDGFAAYVNDQACTSLGYTREELLKLNITEVDVGPGGEDFARSLAVIRRTGRVTFETLHRRKDGHTFPVEVVSEYLEFDGEGYICARARNIEERRRAEGELKRARDQAQEALAARDRFLAMMSHEIRTPMNGVIGMASLLRETRLTPEQLEFVEIIRTSGSDLLTIINDILDFSKVEAGKIDFERHTFALRECLEDGLGLLQATARKKGLALDLTFRDDVPNWICSDPTRIRQVLVNLVGNAVKFTEEGSVSVDVWATAEGERHLMLGVTVSDTGPGITQGRMDQLFEPFTQADVTTTRKFGGTGLGLAICRRLCEGLGGEISVESEEGKGAQFTFIIPVEEAAEPAEAVGAPPDPDTGRDPGLRILLAEDNPVNQRVALRMLERLGYRADVAADGFEVMEAHVRTDYDVILMDIRMPHMDGLEAARQIRASVGHQPHIVALTANAMSGDRERCVEVGMNDYVPKPIVFNALAGALKRVPKQ